MSEIRITLGGQFEFIARLEEEDAPKTCHTFSVLLPFQHKLIQARWSGEAGWIPLLQYPPILQYPTDRKDNEKFMQPPLSTTDDNPNEKNINKSINITLNDFVSIGFENHTSHPGAGQLLLYPGGFSEPEILFPYGSTCFASKMGQLAGNHFLTIVQGNEHFKALGYKVLWEGAQDILFEKI